MVVVVVEEVVVLFITNTFVALEVVIRLMLFGVVIANIGLFEGIFTRIDGSPSLYTKCPILLASL